MQTVCLTSNTVTKRRSSIFQISKCLKKLFNSSKPPSTVRAFPPHLSPLISSTNQLQLRLPVGSTDPIARKASTSGPIMATGSRWGNGIVGCRLDFLHPSASAQRDDVRRLVVFVFLFARTVPRRGPALARASLQKLGSPKPRKRSSAAARRNGMGKRQWKATCALPAFVIAIMVVKWSTMRRGLRYDMTKRQVSPLIRRGRRDGGRLHQMGASKAETKNAPPCFRSSFLRRWCSVSEAKNGMRIFLTPYHTLTQEKFHWEENTTKTRAPKLVVRKRGKNTLTLWPFRIDR